MSSKTLDTALTNYKSTAFQRNDSACDSSKPFQNCSLCGRDVETVEYFLLPASYKVSRFRVCDRFQLLSSKCFPFHKNLTASAFTSLPHVL